MARGGAAGTAGADGGRVRGESDKNSAESVQLLAAKQEELEQLPAKYAALLTSCKDIEQHLVAVQSELEQYEAHKAQQELEVARRLVEKQARCDGDVDEVKVHMDALVMKLAQQLRRRSRQSMPTATSWRRCGRTRRCDAGNTTMNSNN